MKKYWATLAFLFSISVYSTSITLSKPEKVIDNKGKIKSLAVSPSGKWLAFSSDIRDKKGDIILMNLKTGETEYLTYHSALDSQPVFSTDEKFIFFFSNREGSGRIYRISIEKPHIITSLTPKEHWCEFPDVSPNGKSIVYYSKRNAGYHLYEMNISNKKEKKLTSDAFFHFGSRYSSDSKYIFYYSNRDGIFSIYSFQRSTKKIQKITSLEGFTFQPTMDYLGQFYFAVNNFHHNNYDIYLIPFMGKPIRITESYANDFYPYLHTKTRSVYFISQRNGGYGIYKIKF